MFSCFKDKAFLKKFISISLPVMMSAFITFLVSFIDNLMVGTVSNEAVSGVYAANEVTFIFTLMVFGVLEGAGIFIQQFHGKKDFESERKCFRFKIIAAIIFLLLMVPFTYYGGRQLIWFYSKSDSNAKLIFNEGVQYLDLIIISYIPYSIGYVYSTTLREIGETKYAMISSIIAIISNTIFNGIFIFGFKLGVRGAAYGTIIARIIEMILLIGICHLKKFEFCKDIFKKRLIDKKLALRIMKKGFLLFLNEIGYGVGTMAQSLAFSQRDGVLSAISILTTISNVIVILIQGLSTSFGVMLGQDLGQDDFEKAWEDNKKLNLLAFYMCLFIGIILISLSPILPNLFKEVDFNQKVIATKLLIIYASLLVFNCWSVTCYFTLKAGGKTFETLVLDTGSLFILYLPVSWVLALCTNIDIILLYLIVRLLDILRTAIGFTLVGRKKWLVNLTLEEE